MSRWEVIKNIKLRIILLSLLTIVAIISCKFGKNKPQKLEDLNFYTEDMFPFQYTVDGKLKGVCYDVVFELCSKLKIKPDVQVFDWEKSSRKAAKDKNSCLFSVTRTKSRENQYWWIGPIIKYDIAVYKLKKRNDIKIKDIKELNNYKLLIKNDSFYSNIIMKQHGVEKFTEIEESIKNKALYALNELFAENTELIVLSKLETEAMCEFAGYDFDKLEIAYENDDLNSDLYLGLNKEIDNKIMEKVTTAFEKLRNDGSLKEILNKYEF